jgi:hypothetical protein
MVSIVDKKLPRAKTEVAASIFSLIIGELIQYCVSRADHSNDDLEKRLSSIGE